MRKRRVLLSGGSGRVGRRLKTLLSQDVDVLVPTRKEMDLTSAKSIRRYIETHHPQAIIHAAAFTDNTQAEKERGDKHGLCWKINVDGTTHIQAVANDIGAYMIFLSTGSVFSGSRNMPGPFTERDAPAPNHKLSWYGVTKKQAESRIRGTVIRISHPVSYLNTASYPLDYIDMMIDLADKGKLYPMFSDHFFPITLLEDVHGLIQRLLEKPTSGTFHVASADSCTPYELMQTALRLRGKSDQIQYVRFRAFRRSSGMPRRFTPYCAIDGSYTRSLFGLPSRSWSQVVTDHAKHRLHSS